MYYNRYQDVLAQINHENAMAEQIRQFNQEYEMRVKEYEEGIRQFNEEIARLKEKDEKEYQLQIQELELKKKQLQEEKRQFDAQMALAQAQQSSPGPYVPPTEPFNGNSTTDAFINSFVSVSDKNRYGVSDAQYEQYFVNKLEDSNLSDAEEKYLADYYGFTL
jgi:TolA-binding protein